METSNLRKPTTGGPERASTSLRVHEHCGNTACLQWTADMTSSCCAWAWAPPKPRWPKPSFPMSALSLPCHDLSSARARGAGLCVQIAGVELHRAACIDPRRRHRSLRPAAPDPLPMPDRSSGLQQRGPSNRSQRWRMCRDPEGMRAFADAIDQRVVVLSAFNEPACQCP